MKIAIDLDRTIVDCDSILFKIANLFATRQSLKKGFHYTHVLSRENGVRFQKAVKFLDEDNYREIQNASSYIKKWSNMGAQICVLSSRPNWKSLRALTSAVVDKMGLYDKVDIVIACNDKASFCRDMGVDILIDDSIHICQNADKIGVYSIFFSKGKKEPSLKNGTSVETWREVSDIVEKRILEEEEQFGL